MEASPFAGAAPAVTDPPAQPEPTAPSTPEPTQPEPVQSPLDPNAPVDPTKQALEEMSQKIDSLVEQRQPEPATDLLAALEGEPEPETDPAAQLEATNPAEGFDDPAAQQQLQELENFVDQRAQSIVAPIVQERREEQIRGLQTKYPDIIDPKILQPLEQLVTGLAQRSGNDELISDPMVVEMAYRAVKAEQADAGAVPAEQAATNGASLETNAGHTQAGDPSPEEKYKSDVYGTAPTRSEFG